MKKVKVKTVFDFTKDIYQKPYDPDYWNSLSESDQKSWNSYMIHRIMSMNPELISIVLEIMVTAGNKLTGKELYKVYSSIVPKSKRSFYKYIKAEKESPKEVLDVIAKRYEISHREAELYLELFLQEGGVEYVTELIMGAGYSDKEAKKMIKGL